MALVKTSSRSRFGFHCHVLFPPHVEKSRRQGDITLFQRTKITEKSSLHCARFLRPSARKLIIKALTPGLTLESINRILHAAPFAHSIGNIATSCSTDHLPTKLMLAPNRKSSDRGRQVPNPSCDEQDSFFLKTITLIALSADVAP